MNVIFYSTPAFGHVNPSLALCSALVSQNHQVLVYSSSDFEHTFKNVCTGFIPYDFTDIEFDMTVGDKLLNLSELILRFTVQNIDTFISDAIKFSPDVIIYDTLALWGRVVGSVLKQHRLVKTVSINAFSAVHSKKTKAFRMYMSNVSLSLLKQFDSIPSIVKSVNALHGKYSVSPIDPMSAIMNPAEYNVYTYPRCLHPDGFTLPSNNLFLGPTACKRDRLFNKLYSFDNIVYVSLGTIFNDNDAFWRTIIDDFGNTRYNVVMSCMDKADKYRTLSKYSNIHIYDYVDQRSVLTVAKAFISCGGMNSICEAASFGVPCVLLPQQSEQNMNATMFEKNGLGVKVRKLSAIYSTTDNLIHTYHADDMKKKCFMKTHIQKFVDMIEI